MTAASVEESFIKILSLEVTKTPSSFVPGSYYAMKLSATKFLHIAPQQLEFWPLLSVSKLRKTRRHDGRRTEEERRGRKQGQQSRDIALPPGNLRTTRKTFSTEIVRP